jgi:hypothetical protein
MRIGYDVVELVSPPALGQIAAATGTVRIAR